MDGKFWTNAARIALTGSCALALAMPALGQSETLDQAAAIAAAVDTANMLPQNPRDGMLASQPSDFASSFKPFIAGTAEIVLPDHAVDITTIVPAEPEAKGLGSGVASYYGRRFAGRPTASGERFDPTDLTAAHRTLPFGSLVRVTNPRNGQSVVVRINDRGPFAHGRHIDLSRRAAEQIDLVRAGHGSVEMELLAG